MRLHARACRALSIASLACAAGLVACSMDDSVVIKGQGGAAGASSGSAGSAGSTVAMGGAGGGTTVGNTTGGAGPGGSTGTGGVATGGTAGAGGTAGTAGGAGDAGSAGTGGADMDGGVEGDAPGEACAMPEAGSLQTFYLSDLNFAFDPSNGWGPVERDMSNGENAAFDGHKMSIGGLTFDKGLGAHPTSLI